MAKSSAMPLSNRPATISQDAKLIHWISKVLAYAMSPRVAIRNSGTLPASNTACSG